MCAGQKNLGRFAASAAERDPNLAVQEERYDLFAYSCRRG
jgi:hypothetical protein